MNISFSLTKAQIRARSKTVTRRLGWKNLKAGKELTGVEKGQGLRKGEKVVKLCAIRTVDVRREPLERMIEDEDYGRREVILEGFPHLTPAEFVAMFIQSHPRCDLFTEVTRIEFEYLESA